MLNISEKLLKFRTELRYNQTQIAEKVGESQRTWFNYEMGEWEPSEKVLIELEKLGFQYKDNTVEEPVVQSNTSWSRPTSAAIWLFAIL